MGLAEHAMLRSYDDGLVEGIVTAFISLGLEREDVREKSVRVLSDEFDWPEGSAQNEVDAVYPELDSLT